MKVRILGNTLRFRLKQSEVSRFKEDGEVSEITQFGTDVADQLSFVLKVSSGNQFLVSFKGNSVVVQVPQSIATEWAGTGQVGFEQQINTGKGAVVSILVEKDFKCLDRSDIEDEDAYPNPNLHC